MLLRMDDFVKVLKTVEEPAVKLKRGFGGPHPWEIVAKMYGEHLDAIERAIDNKCCRPCKVENDSEEAEKHKRSWTKESIARMQAARVAKAAKRVK